MITPLRRPGSDPLTPADYREMFEELRAGRTLRQFVAAAGAPEGRIAYWSRYGRDPEMAPDLQARNELRTMVGLPLLEPAAAAVIEDQVDPGAAVYLAGKPNGPAGRAVLISGHEDVTITWPAEGEPAASVGARKRDARQRRRSSLSVGLDLHRRFTEGRQAAGLSVEEYLEQLMRMAQESRE